MPRTLGIILRIYQKEFESIGAKYVVVRSLDEFIKVVDNYLKDI